MVGVVFASRIFAAEFDGGRIAGDDILDFVEAKNFYFGAKNLIGDTRSGALMIQFPKGSIDPGSHKRIGAPLGGTQFKLPFASFGGHPVDEVGVRYIVKFAHNFDFVRGGKLNGVYGGTANTGGRRPNGTDGFSVRIVWRRGGLGALYAYLPSSPKNVGTLLGEGAWVFRPGEEYDLVLWTRLNTVGNQDGALSLWVNGRLVYRRTGLVFRSTAALKVDGLFFSTFFGGRDPSWASTRSTQVIVKEVGVLSDREKPLLPKPR